MRRAIRPARLDDVDALLALEEEAFPSDRLERRAFRHAVRSPTVTLLVAEGGRGLAGYALIERRRNSRVARLASIAVAGSTRGEGLGLALLRAAEEEAARHGCERLRLR